MVENIFANIGVTALMDSLFVIVSFILMIAIIKHFAWDKIVQTMEARRTKISTDLDVAESKRKEAEQIQAQAKDIIQSAENKASSILTESRSASEKLQKEMLNEAKNSVAKMKQDGQHEVELMKQHSLVQMENKIVELSVGVAEQILKKELTPEIHQQIIEEFIEGLDC
ncbi:F-type H+-transporting ATPase subunit b [Granulicatella balaenopterae]|uniref:ATP synthase subunit b n=1 Tax=Granulicatella balaenopterae TaxID=137733 RepID=A0A1H9KIE8_9LACT|nr:F0F1 ATP synthase subunit B [Granulicatella balaenopterae]SEQ98916.1 F-type H+-transporting ATPase subunit b [Granulicatella balaenopterae]